MHANAARTIYDAALRPDHPKRATTLTAVGALYYHTRRYEEALAVYEQALQIWQASRGPDDIELLVGQYNYGEALAALGRDREAMEILRQSLAGLERVLGPDHVYCAFPLKGIGLIYFRRGQARQAVMALGRALKLHDNHPGHAVERADTEWALAQALVASGSGHAARKSTSRARELARAAKTFYESTPDPFLLERARIIATWLGR
jgi:tetratricopeptide (TPR) repeat protein